MSLTNNILVIWKNKGQILEGIKNSVFKKEDVEQLADHRMGICVGCELFDEKGDGCMVTGTGPCCDQTKGGCGCSLKFKTRSLSSACPKNKWGAEMSEQEEDLLKRKLGID
jgi:hypothetical protein